MKKKPTEYLKFTGKGKLPQKSKVMHYHRCAYCIAKDPIFDHAIFVIPPQINRFTNKPYETYYNVTNESAKIAEIGKWYSLAYCEYADSGEDFVVPFQPNAVSYE